MHREGCVSCVWVWCGCVVLCFLTRQQSQSSVQSAGNRKLTAFSPSVITPPRHRARAAMALSKLSADEHGIILGQLLNPLEPRLAVYFSSTSSELQVLLTPALRQQLRADHEVAAALCRNINYNGAHPALCTMAYGPAVPVAARIFGIAFPISESVQIHIARIKPDCVYRYTDSSARCGARGRPAHPGLSTRVCGGRSAASK